MSEFPFSRGVDQAYVMFCDAPQIRLLRPFRRGFRHCFALIPMPGGWVSIDPLWGRLELMTHDAPIDLTFINLFKKNDLTIVLQRINHKQFFAPWPFPLTCVGVIKRLLGVRAWWVQTPWTLYFYLTRFGGGVTVSDPAGETFSNYSIQRSR